MCVISKAQGKPIRSSITDRKLVSAGSDVCRVNSVRVALCDHGRTIGVDGGEVPPSAGDDLPVALVGRKITCTSARMRPLPSSRMPAFFRTVLAPPSQPTRVGRPQFLARAGPVQGLHHHANVVLGEVLQRAAVAHGDVGRRLQPPPSGAAPACSAIPADSRLQQEGAVRALGDLLATLRHRGYFAPRSADR